MSQIIVNGFNVGTDLQSVIITDLTGGATYPVETLGHLTTLAGQQESTPLTSTPVVYNGRRFHRNIYHDFSGRLEFDRYNAALTALVLSIMQRFQQTGQETYFSILATVNNTSAGSQDDFLFHQIVFDQHNFGQFSGTEKVGQTLNFRCQQLVQSANNS